MIAALGLDVVLLRQAVLRYAGGFGSVALALALTQAPIHRLQPNVTKTYEPKATALALGVVVALLALPVVRRNARPRAAGLAVAAGLLVAALNTHALAVDG